MKARPGTAEWHALTPEEVIDPEREIVDAHHHLWPETDSVGYGIDQLLTDTGAGHNVTKTVFAECGAGYRPDGDPAHTSVGETEFVAAAASELLERHPGRALTRS